MDTLSIPVSWLEILDLAVEQPTGCALLFDSRQEADDARRLLYTARLSIRKENPSLAEKYDALSISIAPHAADILYIYHTEQVTKVRQEYA